MSFLILITLLANPDTPIQPPIPSGMDLLYGDRLALSSLGEPIVALGLMTGQKKIVVWGDNPVVVDFYEKGVAKRAIVPGKKMITVNVNRAQLAKNEYYVDIESVAHKNPQELDDRIKLWRARDLENVEAIVQGTVLGIGGRVLDNREYRIVLPAANKKDAAKKAREIYKRFDVQAVVRSRLAERPWGELGVKAAASPLGVATSFVRFVPQDGKTIHVSQVEFGRGYKYHAREDRHYHGEVYAVIGADGNLVAVNSVPAERMLRGLVPAEIFAVGHPEALKAQAVAARGQVLAKLGKRHHADPFHLCSEQHCQVYIGQSKEDPRTTAAVKATAGETLFFGTTLVDTVYSSTCGGFTGDNDTVWGNDPDPALRGRPDFIIGEHLDLKDFIDGINEQDVETWVNLKPTTFCAQTKHIRPNKFRWVKRFSAAQIQERINTRYPGLGKLKSISVVERGRGGRVISLRIKGEKASVEILREWPIRRFFSNLNSGVFALKNVTGAGGTLKEVIFSGAGWGHGVGMCQMGAMGRAEAGQNYREILSHYYNGAVIVPLYRVSGMGKSN